MASFPLALGAVEFAAFDALQSIFSTSPRRAILWDATDINGSPVLDQNGQPVQSAFYPQVVVEERHIDQLRITQHPVEFGASITDHAYKLPARVQIRAASAFGSVTAGPVSAIASIVNSAASIIPKATDPSELQALYEVILGIQVERSFVTLVTGKRTYGNMLLEALSVTTDEKTENVLSFVADFQEVLLAYTQTVSVPDAAVMKAPQSNAAPTNLGQTSLLPGGKISVSSANSVLSSALQLA